MNFSDIKKSLLHFFFPHTCAGCGKDLPGTTSSLCLRCIHSLPATGFERYPDNPVERTFWGRLRIEQATACFYFSKSSLIQRLMHEFKYCGNRELGKQLGQLMGHSLTRTDRFTIDALLPLPLFPKKERQRGFNQAAILCRGMTEILNVPILDKLITRPQFTTTQTKKGRIERWKNMEGKFKLLDPGLIMNKHVLLVDDVVTTGATLEACGQEILKAGNVRLSVMTLCYTGV